MSDTPKTDAVRDATRLDMYDEMRRIYDLSRDLEREAMRLRDALEEINRLTMSHVVNGADGFRRCKEIASEALSAK